mmetsp:Transcript_32542/g.83177  ORF Transcript_32542/g.83177 Transcript_32542/m.83177 type:complete len:236 (+) Transcript_32542:4721-5428(+)
MSTTLVPLTSPGPPLSSLLRPIWPRRTPWPLSTTPARRSMGSTPPRTRPPCRSSCSPRRAACGSATLRPPRTTASPARWECAAAVWTSRPRNGLTPGYGRLARCMGTWTGSGRSCHPCLFSETALMPWQLHYSGRHKLVPPLTRCSRTCAALARPSRSGQWASLENPPRTVPPSRMCMRTHRWNLGAWASETQTINSSSATCRWSSRDSPRRWPLFRQPRRPIFTQYSRPSRRLS